MSTCNFLKTSYRFSLKNSSNYFTNQSNFQIMPFYAVAIGRISGIFMTWADCEAQVKGFTGARYKKFDSINLANDFIASKGKTVTSNTNKIKNNVKSINETKSITITKVEPPEPEPNVDQNQDKNRKSNKRTTTVKSENYISDGSDSDNIDCELSNQLEKIERSLKKINKGVDKIISNQSSSTGRKAILLEPSKPKKRKVSSNYEFDENSDGFIIVYTDGACSANGKKGARAGLGVFWGDDNPHNVSEPVSGRATNNCGEIQAAIRAIQVAVRLGIKKLAIKTDSQFLINSVTKWMPGWKAKGWKLASGEPVKNVVDFKELDYVQKLIKVKWIYVEAHRGVYGNEMADQLAKAGAAMYKLR